MSMLPGRQDHQLGHIMGEAAEGRSGPVLGTVAKWLAKALGRRVPAVANAPENVARQGIQRIAHIGNEGVAQWAQDLLATR